MDDVDEEEQADDADEWAAVAATWDDEPLVVAYADAAMASLVAVTDDIEVDVVLPGARVCDFGGGTGLLAERLAEHGAHVDVVDASPAMLAVLRRKIDGGALDGVDAHDALPRGTLYDLVTCSSVCAFVDDYPGLVAHLCARLRPGGLFIQWDWERTSPDDHVGLDRRVVADVLVAAGLRSVTVRTAFDIDADGTVMRPLVGFGVA